jgi:hypothetical protein
MAYWQNADTLPAFLNGQKRTGGNRGFLLFQDRKVERENFFR